jgi:hypothetical protein
LQAIISGYLRIQAEHDFSDQREPGLLPPSVNPNRDCSYQAFLSIHIYSVSSVYDWRSKRNLAPPGSLHARRLRSKDAKDAKRSADDANGANNLQHNAVTDRNFKSSHIFKHPVPGVLMFQAKHCSEFGHILAVSKHALRQHQKKQVEPYGTNSTEHQFE